MSISFQQSAFSRTLTTKAQRHKEDLFSLRAFVSSLTGRLLAVVVREGLKADS